MPTPRTKATAAPRTLAVNGREWRFSPLRQIDRAELMAWVQDEYIRVTRKAIEGLPQEERTAFLARALDNAALLTMESAEYDAIMTRPYAQTRMIYMSLRQCHPEVTVDEVFEAFDTVPSIVAALMLISRLNTIKHSANGKAAPAKKKTVKRRAKAPKKKAKRKTRRKAKSR